LSQLPLHKLLQQHNGHSNDQWAVAAKPQHTAPEAKSATTSWTAAVGGFVVDGEATPAEAVYQKIISILEKVWENRDHQANYGGRQSWRRVEVQSRPTRLPTSRNRSRIALYTFSRQISTVQLSYDLNSPNISFSSTILSLIIILLYNSRDDNVNIEVAGRVNFAFCSASSAGRRCQFL
jgi:hypothetical protein